MPSGVRDIPTEELVAELILRISRMQSELRTLEQDNTELRLTIAGLNAQIRAGRVSLGPQGDLN